MTNYLVLSAHPSLKTKQWVERQSLGTSDIRPLWRGRIVEPSTLAEVRLLVNDRPPSDLLANPLGLILPSQRMMEVISSLIGKDEVQFIEAPVYSLSTGARIHGYFILNPLRRIAALSAKCVAEHLSVEDLEINTNRVPMDVCIFGLSERTFLVVKEEVLEGLRNAGLKDFYTVPIKSIIE